MLRSKVADLIHKQLQCGDGLQREFEVFLMRNDGRVLLC